MRVLLALILIAAAGAFGFGFLATFEPVEGALWWRLGYGVAIAACLLGARALLRRAS